MLFIKSILEQLKTKLASFFIFCDNQFTISICNEDLDKVNARTKHVERTYYYIKHYTKSQLKLIYLQSSDQVADIFTKSLGGEQLQKFSREMCLSSIKGIKYLYKYVYKGSPKSIVTITDQKDEIFTYKNTSYSSVVRLPAHLPNEQIAVIDPDKDIQDLLKDNEKTKLTQWFKYNASYNDALDLTYIEFSEKYVWVGKDQNSGKKNFWKKANDKRKRTIVPRIYVISPKQTEQFYLRKTLNLKIV